MVVCCICSGVIKHFSSMPCGHLRCKPCDPSSVCLECASSDDEHDTPHTSSSIVDIQELLPVVALENVPLGHGELLASDQPLGPHHVATLRKGKWSQEEILYTAKLIELFTAGALSLPKDQDLTLKSFLADKLDCDPMRIVKKLAGVRGLASQTYVPSSVVDDVRSALLCEMDALEINFRRKISENTLPETLSHTVDTSMCYALNTLPEVSKAKLKPVETFQTEKTNGDIVPAVSESGVQASGHDNYMGASSSVSKEGQELMASLNEERREESQVAVSEETEEEVVKNEPMESTVEWACTCASPNLSSTWRCLSCGRHVLDPCSTLNYQSHNGRLSSSGVGQVPSLLDATDVNAFRKDVRSICRLVSDWVRFHYSEDNEGNRVVTFFPFLDSDDDFMGMHLIDKKIASHVYVPKSNASAKSSDVEVGKSIAEAVLAFLGDARRIKEEARRSTDTSLHCLADKFVEFFETLLRNEVESWLWSVSGTSGLVDAVLTREMVDFMKQPMSTQCLQFLTDNHYKVGATVAKRGVEFAVYGVVDLDVGEHELVRGRVYSERGDGVLFSVEAQDGRKYTHCKSESLRHATGAFVSTNKKEVLSTSKSLDAGIETPARKAGKRSLEAALAELPAPRKQRFTIGSDKQ